MSDSSIIFSEVVMRICGFVDLSNCLYVAVDKGFNLELARQRLLVSIILEDDNAVHTDSLSQLILAASTSGLLIGYPGGYDREKFGHVSRLKFYFDMAPGKENHSIYARVISKDE